jgi:threo-3-hydroxy-L-aspartate ammonia-lyase
VTVPAVATSSIPVTALTIDDVLSAAARLRGRIERTPVVRSEALDAATGAHVFLKCENLQVAGSFKIRGALNKLLTLDEADRARGVVAFSSGNHAQGVALAARTVGASAVVCMPTDAPPLKIAGTRAHGAEVVFYDRQRDDREAVARRIAAETGRVVVPPYDDPAVMAGQGTAALELLEEVPDLDVLLTPVGGGGLMAGCGTVMRSRRPGARIFGVEAESANDTYLSLRKGERVTIPPPSTLADGIRVTTPGALTFPVLRTVLTDVVLVSEEEIVAAVRFLAVDAHLVVEATGGLGVAALLGRRVPDQRGARVGVVLSGGNIDARLLASLLS